MGKPKLLDAFCKAGGAGMGYHQAGFEVVGVDIEPQPRYPFEFVQADAIDFIAQHGHEFDIIHASPPCQAYSVTAPLSNGNHPELIEPTRAVLLATGKPYVIENVPGSPLTNPITLCGTMFGLRVIRHRLFETSPAVWWPPSPCQHIGKVAPMFWGDLVATGHNGGSRLDKFQYITVSGHNFIGNDAKIAMGINWMINRELSQAIPPAFTKWLGKRLIETLRLRTANNKIQRDPKSKVSIGPGRANKQTVNSASPSQPFWAR